MKAIIFDLDGTLIRLPINYPRLLQRLQNLFGTQDEIKPLIPSVVRFAKKNNILLNEAFEIITEEEQFAINIFEIIDGAQEILAYFKEHEFALGLVTMQGRKTAQTILEKLAPSTFEYVMTRDESHDRLEQIQKTIQNFLLEPNQTIMVGDRIHDVECAKNAGCIPILFKNTPTNYHKSRVISHLSELKNLT